MTENSQCTNYLIFKQNLEMEDYLVQLEDDATYTIAKFRTRTHHLPVTKNRFLNDNSEDITWPLCQGGDVGDEFHYLYKCSYFNESRAKYLSNNPHNTPDIICMQSILDGSKDHLENIAKFRKLIMKKFAFKKGDANICPVTKKKELHPQDRGD